MRQIPYQKQAGLLLDILPLIDKHAAFALKGGTAINFFIRDLPRLSVDIDLTYLPITEREQALSDITDRLLAIQRELQESMLAPRVMPMQLGQTGFVKGLVAATSEATVKIEPNTTIRGIVYRCERRNLCPTAERLFERAVEMQVVSHADLYGGKICAALDRQHPRDLFDIKLLLDAEGLTEETRKAFIVYLISHDRPMVELLSPHMIPIEEVFGREFDGMTREPVTVQELIQVREELVKLIAETLTDNERTFLLSVKKGEPQWGLLGLDGIQEMPAVKWKLQNIRMMRRDKHQEAIDRLRRYLDAR